MRIKHMHTTHSTRLALAIALVTAGLPLAHAQTENESTEQTQGPRLEELIVTAQKRAESLQDVPLSVATVSGQKIQEAGIETLEDLTAYLPNIHFTETGISTQVRVRGIGSDNSQGFEQSVGMYVDGIYHGRAQLFRAPMMDMERVEMLRGPQSTLFGKNSIAGALNLTTARPTDEFTGQLSYSHEFEHEQDELNVMLSGPITDTLAARIAVRTYEEDGYFYNSFKGIDESAAEEESVRVSLTWDPTDNLSIFLKAETNEFETRGRAIEITQDQPLTAGGANYAQTLAVLSQPELESDQQYRRQTDLDESSTNEINSYTLSADYEFNDHTLTLVSGWLDFEYNEICDCDFTASEILNLKLGEGYEQFSQEIRIASPTDQKVDWIAGLFYQNWEQSFDDELSVSNESFLVSALSPALADTGLRRDFDQTSDSIALFGRATWHLSDKLHVTLGARYTQEEKEASKVLELYTPSTGDVANDPTLGWIYLNAFLVESEQATTAFLPTDPVTVLPLEYSGHNVKKSRDETAFTPLINVEYDVHDDMMAYASFTTGFKAGGFDPRSNSVGNFAAPEGFAPDTEENPHLFFEFEEEKATAYELGLKTTIADGRGEINMALYRTDYDDLQISQFDGAVGFNVGNANETRVQGIELDGRWAITDHLQASYGFSWLDFEYKDFKNGNCYAGQTPDGVDLDGDDIIDTCDYTGKRGVYAPDYTLNLSFDYRRELFRDIQFVSFIDIQQVDGHNVHVNLDPQGEIDTYTTVAARLGLESEHWSVALLGKNLTDEYIVSYSANAPLSDSTFGTNSYYSMIRRPMTVALEGTLKF